MAVNGGQRRSTMADHREPPPDLRWTSARPSPNHRRTTSQPPVNGGRNSSLAGSGFGSGCHVAPLGW
ncbi:hypothetical protein Tco_1160540, partial [Tanacetum coccineum]